MSDVYLIHHGVKGMKWGVRHDKDKSSGTTKHKFDKQKAKRIAKKAVQTAVVGAIVYSDLKKIGQDASNGVLAKNRYTKTSELYNFRTGKMDTTKRYGIFDNEHMGAGFGMTGKSFKDINQNMVKNMNPMRSRENCFHCSIGYILNSIHDQNVQALDFNKNNPFSNSKGTAWTAIDLMFDNVGKTDYTRGASTYKELPNLSDVSTSIRKGTTGIMLIHNDDGDGHYVNYEKDRAGNTNIVDTQNGVVLSPSEYQRQSNSKAYVEKSFDFTNSRVAEDADWIIDGFVKKRR